MKIPSLIIVLLSTYCFYWECAAHGLDYSIGLFVLGILVTLAISLVMLVFQRFARNAIIHFLGQLIIVAAAIIGGRVMNVYLTERSMMRGDELVTKIEYYRAKFGAYPLDLTRLREINYSIPEPLLLDSTFQYRLASEEYAVGFLATSGGCWRTNTQPKWHCAD